MDVTFWLLFTDGVAEEAEAAEAAEEAVFACFV
jgi:hypothetical protein